MSIAQCNVCPDDETRFKIPWGDIHSQALMEEHFKDKHPDVDLYGGKK